MAAWPTWDRCHRLVCLPGFLFPPNCLWSSPSPTPREAARLHFLELHPEPLFSADAGLNRSVLVEKLEGTKTHSTSNLPSLPPSHPEGSVCICSDPRLPFSSSRMNPHLAARSLGSLFSPGEVDEPHDGCQGCLYAPQKWQVGHRLSPK